MRGSTVRSDTLEGAGATGTGPGTALAVVVQAADSLISSTEPSVVFDDLVQRSAPLVCDAARVMVYGPGATLHASTWPQDAAQQQPEAESVVTEVKVPASGDHDGYHAIVSLRFGFPDHSHPFIARLLVDRAIANVEQARLAEIAARHKAEADNLAIALGTNRDIGVAVGIVMVNHALNRDEAFALLSRASQSSNRKLHDIALEVVRVG
jgi:hypothetical protein